MKLSEVLNSDESMHEWLGKHATFKRFDTHEEIPIENIKVENGLISFQSEDPTVFQSKTIQNTNNEHFVWLTIDMYGEVFNPPGIIKISKGIVLCDNIMILNAIINDWSKLDFTPSSNGTFDYVVNGSKSVVNSWNGLQKLKIGYLQFNWESNDACDIKCGLLELLDIPSIDSISYHVYGKLGYDPEDRTQRLEQACEIVTEHLQSDRDHFSCQEDLIDAGLEEFA